MLYTCMNDARIRANIIGVKLNEATNYGRRPLPPEFADLSREWRELAVLKPADFLTGGVEVAEADKKITARRRLAP